MAETLVTFDLWDTLFIDDSDEPKRAELGLPPKAVLKKTLFNDLVQRTRIFTAGEVDVAWNAATAGFKKCWFDYSTTWTAAERLTFACDALGVSPKADAFKAVVEQMETMELNPPPNLIPGVKDALKALKGKYHLGVISDTVYSPGRVLRKLLAGEGILEYFSVLIFSDEVGCSKPNPLVFKKACEQAGVPTSRLIHIGDREPKDILGPQAVGGRGILCTAAVTREVKENTQDGAFSKYGDLPAIIERLARSK